MLSAPATSCLTLRAAPGEPDAPRLLVTASCLASSHLELLEVSPPLSALRPLLQARPYGDAAERGAPDAPPPGCSWEELSLRVQCSEAQLRDGLKALDAFLCRGRWCLLEQSYLQRLLDMLLLTAQSNGWPLSAVPGEALASSLAEDGYDDAVSRHALTLFAAPSPGDLWALQLRPVAVAKARAVLGAAGNRMRLSDFLPAWQKAVPEELGPPQLDMLRAEALTETAVGEQWIAAFPIDALPRSAKARFEALFARRARWTRAEIEPYLAGVEEAGATADALLLAWCRKSQAKKADPETFTPR